MFVPQSRKRPRLERGVIFIDDDPEPQNDSMDSQSWKTESDSQAAGMSSSCCVSTILGH